MWNKDSKNLLDMVNKKKHTNVPQKYVSGLGSLVNKQRLIYDKLSDKRKRKLLEVGFETNPSVKM